MTFNEANTVEAFVRHRLTGTTSPATVTPGLARQGGAISGLGWRFVGPADLPRRSQEALVESYLRDALIRLNPDIAVNPGRVDDVLYRLRAILMSARSDGLVKANEEFGAWMLGERSMPFGANGEHVTIRLIDFDDVEQNSFVVTQQFTFRAGKTEKRADLVLLVNGLPLVLIEAKTPVRSSQSWLDAALQVHDDYEQNVPELFVPNVFSVGTEGKEYRYGSVRMPVDLWGPWRTDADGPQSMGEVEKAVTDMLRPSTVLDLLANFTAFATQKGKQRIKIIARYQQVEGVNKIVERVIAGQPRKGLIWHFQGSGKSLLMLFAARKLRLHPALKNPTVLVVVDRIDLDSQISGTFYAADMANLVRTDSRKELSDLLARDVRKVIITTIHKFAEIDGVLNDRDNIIVMVDEAHRTQEGDVAQALKFDEKSVQKAVSNIAELMTKLPGVIQKCLAYFAGVDRNLTGYEGLIAAQDCLPTNDLRDAFAAEFSVVSRIWEALSPDPGLAAYEADYRWLAQIYESLKPSTGTGRLLWHRLGTKTIELIHQNIDVPIVRDDLDTLVLDAELLEAVLGNPDPEKKAKEITVKLTGRLRKHSSDPKFKALGERLEDLKNRHQQGLLLSIDFLKELLELAKDVVKMERETPVEEDLDRGKAALTQLFEEAKNGDTPVMVSRIVDDIDEIVRAVRFDGWQETFAGEREVKQALRQTLFKYKLHQDAELFDRAYQYIREYY